MPQLIGVVIVVALCVIALTALAGAAYAVVLWGPILFVSWIVLQQVQLRRIARFADPAVRGRLAKVSFGGGKVTITANGNALKQYMDLDQWRGGAIVVGMGLSIAIMALAGHALAAPLIHSLPEGEFLRSTGLMGAAAAPFAFILAGGLKMHPQAYWMESAQKGLQELLKRGTAPLDTLQQIDQTQQRTDQLMRRLCGTTAPGALTQANQTLQENVALLFDRPAEMQQRLHALLDPARRQLQRLETFDRAASEARQLQGQVVRLAMNMSHRSLMGLAEDALAMIEAAPRFIVSGEFDKAEQHLAVASQELQAALADPGVFSDNGTDDEEPAGPGTATLDCYARLRIDHSVTAQQLEDLWKRLRQTYHPDKGIANHRAYQALREDVESVARDRGFTLRGFNES